MKISRSLSNQIFESRSVRVAQTSVSWAVKPKYKCSSSQSNRTRVSNHAGSPVTMSTNGLETGAASHDASSSLPSMRGGVPVRKHVYRATSTKLSRYGRHEGFQELVRYPKTTFVLLSEVALAVRRIVELIFVLDIHRSG